MQYAYRKPIYILSKQNFRLNSKLSTNKIFIPAWDWKHKLWVGMVMAQPPD